MENRFGLKDFFIMFLLVIVIVLVVLGMVQFDRQWDLVRQTNAKLSEQTTDIARIRRLLENGGGIATTQANSGSNLTAGFERITKAQSSPDYATGDAIVDTFMAVPDKLTPLITTDSYAGVVQGYVLDSLCERDPNTFEYIPRLASSWKISDDQLTIDFDLRKGVTFSDGEPLTADDVIFTMDWIRNDQVEAPRARTYLDKLDKVVKTGDYSVRFIFKEPYFKSFETASGTQVMSKKFYSKFSPKEYNESTGLLFGSGPYRMADPTSWRPEPGKPIEVVRNERYWGPPPAAKRMIWKVIENPSARVTAFRNGETDVYSNVPPEQYDSMNADPSVASHTQHFALKIVNAGYRYIGWTEVLNGKPTRFTDKRVRKAMTLLINREAICKDIMKGYAFVNSGSFSTMSPQSDPSVQPLPVDVSQAMQLLFDAGYKKSGDTLVGPDGQPFRFKLTYGSASLIAPRIASYVKDNLARAGIIVEQDPEEWSVMLKRVKDKQLEAYIMGWTGGIEEDCHQIFHTDAISGTGDNCVSYSNKELDKLIDQARITVKDELRMPIWHQVHRIIAEDQPYTFLYSDMDLSLIDKRFKNVEATKLGINSTQEWYTPSSAQKYKE